MIEIELFRSRIGLFSGSSKSKGSKSASKHNNILLEMLVNGKINFTKQGIKVCTGNVFFSWFIFCFFYLYFLCLLMSLAIDNSMNKIHTQFYAYSGMYPTALTIILRNNLNSCFLTLILSIFMKCNQNYNHYKNNTITYKQKKCTRISVVATLYTYWIAFLNLILIVMCNPAIINPGPNQDSPKLSVFYQNVRGFVPPTELGEPNPKSLSMEKVIDFQSYIFDKKPDIIILNETWLSKNINESEIFPNEIYKIFRRDRTRSSHPADPNNPTKYRKNGGGVLIAIKNNLDCESIQVKDRCKAEILSVEIRLGCGKSICLSTLYRVGNLEAENHRAVDKYLRGIANRRKFSKVILIGDLNLD